MAVALITIWLCLVPLTACTQREPPSTPPPKISQEGRGLLIGIIPEHNLFKQAERYHPLMKYLSNKIGMEIRLSVLSRYGNLPHNFISERMDGAFFGSFTYALAHTKLGVEPLARPQLSDGASTYHGLILARKTSRIRTAPSMQGKTFAFVDQATTAGYLLPLAYFKKHGIENYRDYFKETYFAGTHEDVIYDVLHSKADVGAAKNTVYKRLADGDRRISQELLILDRSPEVPENGLAVRKDLDSELKKKLKNALLAIDQEREGRELLKVFGAQRFVETIDQDYLPIYRYAGVIGLDLATYDYQNE